MSYDAMRCASPRFRSIMKPLEYNVTENPVAFLVNKMLSYGGWAQIQRHISAVSLRAPKTYCECLVLCVYRNEGVPLEKVQSCYSEKDWIELLHKFLTVSVLHHAITQKSVTAFLSKFTPAEMQSAVELLWAT